MRTPVRLKIPPSCMQLPDTSTRVILPRKRRASCRSKSPLPSKSQTAHPQSLASEAVSDTPSKRRSTAQDEAAKLLLIDKILHETSRKAKDFRKEVKRVRARPDPPCIKYVSRREVTFLSVPTAINLCKALNPAMPSPAKPAKVCKCGEIGRYREPKTGVLFCSVPCYKLLLLASNTVQPC